MKAIEINFVGSWLKNCVQGKGFEPSNAYANRP